MRRSNVCQLQFKTLLSFMWTTSKLIAYMPLKLIIIKLCITHKCSAKHMEIHTIPITSGSQHTLGVIWTEMKNGEQTRNNKIRRKKKKPRAESFNMLIDLIYRCCVSHHYAVSNQSKQLKQHTKHIKMRISIWIRILNSFDRLLVRWNWYFHVMTRRRRRQK